MVRRFSSRPEAAPCCGVLVRAALVDKSLKRHVTITVSGPPTGMRLPGNLCHAWKRMSRRTPVIRRLTGKPSGGGRGSPAGGG